jgi:hypothetical protein
LTNNKNGAPDLDVQGGRRTAPGALAAAGGRVEMNGGRWALGNKDAWA